MNNLIELYEFLEGCDTATLLSKINELLKTLNDKFGKDSGFMIQNHLNNLKNIHKMTKHQFEKDENGFENITVKKENNGITLGTTFVDSSSDISITPTNDKNEPPIANKYRSMDSGDMDFVKSILPYSKNYIRLLCRDGILPYEKPKGKYIFNRYRVEEWKKQHGSEHKKELLNIGKRTRSCLVQERRN